MTNISERAKPTCSKSRSIYFFLVGGLLAITLLTLWLVGKTKKPLTELAQRAARLDDPQVQTCWLSTDKILVITGVFNERTFNWHGHADVVQIDNLKSVPMPGLTALLNRMGWMPVAFKVSPDGKRLLYGLALGDQGAVVVTNIDGTHSRILGFSDECTHYWLDKTHAMFVDGHEDLMGVADAAASVHYEKLKAPWTDMVASIGSQPSDHRISKTSAYGRSLLAKSHNVDPWAVIKEAPEAGRNNMRIAIYATRESAGNTNELPLYTIAVKCPAVVEIPTIFPSPRRDRILYDLRSTQPASSLDLILRRLLPAYHVPVRYLESFWLSDAQGRNMHEIGSQPVKSLEDNEAVIQNTQWSADGTKLSFVFLNSLYVLPSL